MFDNISFTLAAAVADNGTTTVSYPSGRSKGLYDWTNGKHVLFVNGNKNEAPADFTLTFNANASSITVTNKSGGSWAAGSTMRLQVERPGADDKEIKPADKDRVRMVETGVFLLDLGSPNTADADGVCASQSVASGSLASIDGALASGGVATFDVPRNVVGAWTGAAIVTINGTDEYGQTVQEKSSSGTSHTGTKSFKTITSVSFNASVTSATIGTGDVLGLPVAVQKADQILAEYKNGALLPRKPGKVYLPFEIEATELAAATAEQTVVPVAGNVARVRAIVQEAIVTGGTITFANGTATITGLEVTAANSDAAGSLYNDTPTTPGDSSTTVAAGDRLVATPSAAFNGGGAINGVYEIDVSTAGQLDGSLVVAAGTEPSATTGDVRGTYDPSEACNGDRGYKLLVVLADPAEKGLTQYDG